MGEIEAGSVWLEPRQELAPLLIGEGDVQAIIDPMRNWRAIRIARSIRLLVGRRSGPSCIKAIQSVSASVMMPRRSALVRPCAVSREYELGEMSSWIELRKSSRTSSALSESTSLKTHFGPTNASSATFVRHGR